MSFAAQPSSPGNTPPTATAGRATLVLGGGCFWCLEAAYELVPGVIDVESGYAGGHVKKPTYREVCGGGTGHAEVVRITFDPKAVTLERLLELFWRIHDPTTPDRQGNDVGPQYRSIILHADEAQRRAAVASMAEARRNWPSKIVTEIAPLGDYWPAEGHHQDYYRKNPDQGYCRIVIRPKIEKLGKELSGSKR